MAIINFINMMVTMALIGNFIVKWLNYLKNREENMKKNNQKFAERLKELRKINGLTQSQVAYGLGTKQPVYHRWETGERSPSIETLIKLADYFVVSTDYLLGREMKENKLSIFAERLKELRKEIGLTQKEIAERLGMKQNTYSDWENGKSEPNIETLVKSAEFFDVSLDYLLGRIK